MKKQKEIQSHMSLSDRETILKGIENRSTKAAIAQTIGKDSTTVAKEIRKHRELKPRNTYNSPILCAHQNECRKGCKFKCEKYEEPKCKWRDRSPGACNKCPKSYTCKMDRYFYNPENAHKQYLYDLKDSREGFNLTTTEAKDIASIMKPLLDKKQSIYQILNNHKEIGISHTSIYTYIDSEVFKPYGIDYFSLKEKVQRKQPKDKLKKRKTPINYSDRKYVDYLKFIAENPDVNVVQMDTVYNNPSGPYIQTLKFKKEVIQIGFIHQVKDNEAMASTFDYIEEVFGHEWFCTNIPVILTDRGTEFEKWEMFEANNKTGEYRCKIFYCDPMRASQKAECENNHNFVRDIIDNDMDLSNIKQEDLDIVFSHINSTPRKSLNGSTPYELASVLHQKDEFLNKLNIKKIDQDDVTLSPDLLK
jgi:IS30 family transposase